MSSIMLSELMPADNVHLSPPLGHFAAPLDRKLVLLSAGIGVTPMAAFLAAARDRVTLAAPVARGETDNPFRKEFTARASDYRLVHTSKVGCRCCVVVRGQAGGDVVPEAVSHMPADLSGTTILLCGPVRVYVSSSQRPASCGGDEPSTRDVWSSEAALSMAIGATHTSKAKRLVALAASPK